MICHDCITFLCVYIYNRKLCQAGCKNVHKTVAFGTGLSSQKWNYAQGHQGTSFSFSSWPFFSPSVIIQKTLACLLHQGANILVDNKGCIKLADFGASKQVVELVSTYFFIFFFGLLLHFCI